MNPFGDPLRDLYGFRVGDWVICASGRKAIVTAIRHDGKLDAEYLEDGKGAWQARTGDATILDPLKTRHANRSH